MRLREPTTLVCTAWFAKYVGRVQPQALARALFQAAREACGNSGLGASLLMKKASRAEVVCVAKLVFFPRAALTGSNSSQCSWPCGVARARTDALAARSGAEPPGLLSWAFSQNHRGRDPFDDETPSQLGLKIRRAAAWRRMGLDEARKVLGLRARQSLSFWFRSAPRVPVI